MWNRHRGFGGRVVYGTSRQSHEEGAVDCLKRAGLVPKSYTVEQYEKEANAMGHAAPGETVNTTYDMKKPEVLACLAANGNVFMDR